MRKQYFYTGLFLFTACFITFIFVVVFLHQKQPELLAPHQIMATKGLKLAWQMDGIHTAGFGGSDSAMIVKDGKIFFKGTVKKGDITRITILDAKDGSYLAETAPTSYSDEFTTDGASLYIGDASGGAIYKYDYTTGKQVWRKELGYVNGPCCFNILDGELQMSWHVKHYYRISPEDGRIIKEYAKSDVYRLEKGIFYEGSGGVLLASKHDGALLWKAKFIGSPQHQPVFRNGKIFFNGNGTPTGVVYAVEQSNGSILWESDVLAISNVTTSDRRVYFLTLDGVIVGANQGSGRMETFAQLSTEDNEFYSDEKYRKFNTDYQIAFDDDTDTVFLLTGDSGQLFAFQEPR